MIIETRFRDISYEEMDACAVKHAKRRQNCRSWWAANRGKPITIETPSIQAVDFTCDGPFYRVAGEMFAVCPHIAEIGD